MEGIVITAIICVTIIVLLIIYEISELERIKINREITDSNPINRLFSSFTNNYEREDE